MAKRLRTYNKLALAVLVLLVYVIITFTDTLVDTYNHNKLVRAIEEPISQTCSLIDDIDYNIVNNKAYDTYSDQGKVGILNSYLDRSYELEVPILDKVSRNQDKSQTLELLTRTNTNIRLLLVLMRYTYDSPYDYTELNKVFNVDILSSRNRLCGGN